ncbi:MULTISPECIES: hypothetical protein [unclassified Sphingobium]|uniref:hypothetical protein n=1 Tax=unclassified Sphingobium TaxID=2611147 RepID=UPI0035A6C909
MSEWNREVWSLKAGALQSNCADDLAQVRREFYAGRNIERGCEVSSRDDMLRALGALEATLRQSAELADNEQADNRAAGIKLRRLIAEQLSAVNAAGERAFTEFHQLGEFRREIAKTRSALALHQASWPIVAIRRDDPEYMASLLALRETNRKFLAWIRDSLGKAN